MMKTILLIFALEVLFTIDALAVNQSNDFLIATKDAEGTDIEGSSIINFNNLIIDGGNLPTSCQIIETENGGSIQITNVAFRNCNTSDNQGIIGIKDGGSLLANGVSFTDCTVPEGHGHIFVGADNVALSGVVKASVYIEANHYITDAGVGESSVSQKDVKQSRASDSDDNKSKVTLLFDTARDLTQPLIKGNPNLDYYVSGVNGYKLKAADADGNVGAELDTQDGVGEIEVDENAPVEYFNLQGVKVATPDKGLYIMRKGDKVMKVIL